MQDILNISASGGDAQGLFPVVETTRMTARTYYKQSRLEHYRTLCEAAVAENFSSAAAKLGLSRSTVWQQIKTLERERTRHYFSAVAATCN